MAKDTLRIPVGPALQNALGMPKDKQEGLDYYELLGIPRGEASEDQVESALKERSRVLRQWQNSPTSGPEVVKLLPILHRAAKLLKDPRRAAAYRKELVLQEKGETAGGIERFRQLARVALVGNEITSQDKLQLQQAAAHYNLDNNQVRQIIEEVRREYQAARTAVPAEPVEAAEGEPQWEFHVAGDGEDSLMTMLGGLQAAGNHLTIGPQKLLEDVLRYGIEMSRAMVIVKKTMAEWYKDMIRMIAGKGAINEAQTRLLLPKAADFGLTEQEAYNVISEYSVSAVASDDLRKQFELAETAFSEDEIDGILEETSTKIRRTTFFSRLLASAGSSGGMMIGVVAVVVVFAVGYGGIQMLSNRSHVSGDPAPPVAPTPPPVASTATPIATQQLPAEQPDPPTKMLRFAPENAGDPPAFEMHICEVDCNEYSQYVKAVMETPPASWPASGDCPPGSANLPVTGVTWKSATGYCAWLADQQKIPVASIRLPTIAEFDRALRGMTIRAHPGDPQKLDYWVKYWDVSNLWNKNEPSPVMTTAWDKILNGKGQMYDLIGNVAEWGQDSQSDKHVILGGGFNEKSRDFDATKPRWLSPDSAQPWLGFRYVHVLAN